MPREHEPQLPWESFTRHYRAAGGPKSIRHGCTIFESGSTSECVGVESAMGKFGTGKIPDLKPPTRVISFPIFIEVHATCWRLAGGRSRAFFY